MEYTKNLKLKKPNDEDEYDIKNENDNMDILDAAFNMGDIVKVDKEEEIGEPTEEKKRSLFYAFDKERYSFVKHTGGTYYLSLNGYDDHETFDVDAHYSRIQHDLSTDKYYKGSQVPEEVAVSIEEGVEYPTKTYPEYSFILCMSGNVQKLYTVENSEFKEITNFEYLPYRITNYTLERETYYYAKGDNKLFYFYENTWVDLQVTNLPTKPELNYLNANKWFRDLSSEYVYLVREQVPDTLTWVHFISDIDIELLREKLNEEIDKRLLVEKFDVYISPTASEETIGKLLFCNERDRTIYEVAVRDGYKINELAKKSTGTYVEGLLVDRPDAFLSGISVYYATDVNKGYVRRMSTGGLLNFYWQEVDLIDKSYEPYPSKSSVGFYRVTIGDEITIYQVYADYKMYDLTERPQITDTKTNKTTEFKGVYVAEDTGEAPSYIPDGITYETYEVAE